MLDAWAASVQLRLHPGTANACSSRQLHLEQAYKHPLDAFAHLLSLEARRRQPGFAPRLHPIRVVVGENPLFAWIFRWSDDDPGLGFVGDTAACRADRHLEIIAMVGFRTGLGLKDGDEFKILLPEAAV
jgi:hypothetical protein